MSSIDRRTFLKTSALAGAGLPLFNIARAGVPPSAMIRHAGFGAAGMGLADLKNFSRNEHFNLVAVAEVDSTRVGDVLELFPGVKVYKDWRVLLEKEHKNLDSVNVSTPDHMHASIGVTAMNLGLHVYGQKPLAQTLYETRRMAEIARERNVTTQMGIQLSSGTYERLAVQMIQDGVIGKVQEVHVFSHKTHGDPEPRPDRVDPVPASLEWDLWCGVGPKVPYISGHYHPGVWRRRLDYGTGTLGDMGCHIYSPMFRGLGVSAPLSVKSIGGAPNETNWAIDECLEYVFPGTGYTADKTVKVTWYDGALRPPQHLQDMLGDKMPKQGGIFVGTDGILLAPHSGLPRPFPVEKYEDYRHPKLPARHHYMDFLSAVRGEDVVPMADFAAYGGPLTETVLLGGVASRFPHETLEWDAANLRFKNSEAANEFVRRDYREGWDVEGLS